MRRVGDQLIPVGVTSGRLPPGEGGNSGSGGGEGGSGISILTGRPRGGRQALEQFLSPMGMGGQDLEEVCHSFFSAGFSADGDGWMLMMNCDDVDSL
jgi:hypothetical protein